MPPREMLLRTSSHTGWRRSATAKKAHDLNGARVSGIALAGHKTRTNGWCPMVRTALWHVIVLLCASSSISAQSAGREPMIGQSGMYRCASGLIIEILYSGTGDVVITHDEAIVSLRANDVDPSVYQGSGWTWRVVGAEEGRVRRVAQQEQICRLF